MVLFEHKHYGDFQICNSVSLIVMRNFHIDTKTKAICHQTLKEFCDLFCLKNTMKSETYHTEIHKRIIDLIFTNKTSSYQTTHNTEAVLVIRLNPT